MEQQQNQIPQFSYARALQQIWQEHPSLLNPSRSFSQPNLSQEPSATAIVPQHGITQNITMTPINPPDEQPPLGIVAQRLSHYLSMNQPTPSELDRLAMDNKAEMSSSTSSSSTFSTISNKIQSPFQVQMQNRLDRLRDKSDIGPGISTPYHYSQPGVNHRFSNTMVDQATQYHDHAYQRLMKTDADYSSQMRPDTKAEIRIRSQNSVASSDICPRPPYFDPNQTITPKDSVSVVSSNTSNYYYNLQSSTDRASKSGLVNKNNKPPIPPIPKPRKSIRKLPTPSVAVPKKPDFPLRYAHIEHRRSPSQQTSVYNSPPSITNPPPTPPNLPSNSHLDSTAIVPAHHNTLTLAES